VKHGHAERVAIGRIPHLIAQYGKAWWRRIGVETSAWNRNQVMASKLPHHIVTATVDPIHVARIEQREIRGAPTPEIALPGFRSALSGLRWLKYM